MIQLIETAKNKTVTIPVMATLKNDLDYVMDGKEIIVKKGTSVLVDIERSIVLINNEHHTTIEHHEYTMNFPN